MFRKLNNSLLDASIFFSFDRSGFRRHARSFHPQDLEVDLKGRRILVTGANSGLGRSAALQLAHLGAEVCLLCRNPDRGEKALDDLTLASKNDSLRLELVDLADQRSIHAFADRLGTEPVDVLINNAGILPDTRSLTVDGLESTWATNVVGPFLLTQLLQKNLEAAARVSGEARVINVSSGGMYTQKMSLEDLSWEARPFDGVEAYAQTKRAEVILTELWAEHLRGTGIACFSMHPGWADTPAVRTSLPRFWNVMKDRLRTPREGADTIVWLAAARNVGKSGEFYFDRRPVLPHLLPWTRESESTRSELWHLCRRQAGLA